MAPGIQGRAWSSSGTSARTSRSQRMKWHLQLGLAALTGLLILGMLWLRQHEIEMGAQRLEQSELRHTSR